MTEDTESSVKKAFIQYEKLQQLRTDISKFGTDNNVVDVALKTYDEILEVAKELLSKDKEITDSIKRLTKLGEPLKSGIIPVTDVTTLLVDSGVLLSALKSFIHWYLPVEKQRTIGFQREE